MLKWERQSNVDYRLIKCGVGGPWDFALQTSQLSGAHLTLRWLQDSTGPYRHNICKEESFFAD